MSNERTFPGEPVPRRRHPAGHALAVLAVALIAGSLLNADRLAHTARTQPFGWQRTWAVRLTGPVQTMSHATGMNRPRQALSNAAGTTDGPPPGDTETVVTAPPLAAQRQASTTTTAQRRVPSPAEPLRVHVAGDSLMIPVGPTLLECLGDAPVTLTEGFKSATGLARPDVLNWPAKLGQDLTDDDAEVVVLGFGGNDAQPILGPDGPLPSGTAAWGVEYQRRVAQVLDAAEKPGRTLYWLSLPVTTVANIEKAAPLMRRAAETEIAVRPWAHYVDIAPILSPAGTFAAYLPDGSGGQVKVREDDGIHLTRAGAARAVRPLCHSLAKERKLA